MTIYLKDEATSKAVRKLAKLRGTTLTEAVRLAVQEALEAEEQPRKVEEKLQALQALQAEAAKLPRTGSTADKTFFDELWGE
jgi:antitoxin VapB